MPWIVNGYELHYSINDKFLCRISPTEEFDSLGVPSVCPECKRKKERREVILAFLEYAHLNKDKRLLASLETFIKVVG